MNNLEFIVKFVAARVKPGARVLDFGCGEGKLVATFCAAGFDAFGCDYFYDGGSYESSVLPELKDRIIKSAPNSIPFPDGYFDVIVSHTVLEHVKDLRLVLEEINRALAPQGLTMHIFPHREVWHELHTGVPFLHRFAKGSRWARRWALLYRRMGGGLFTDQRTPREWAGYQSQWVDDWTHYLPLKTIDAKFRAAFQNVNHHEAEWIDARRPDLAPLPKSLKQMIARKMVGIAVSATKPAAIDE